MKKCLIICGNNCQNSNTFKLSNILFKKLDSELWIPHEKDIPLVNNDLLNEKFFPINILVLYQFINKFKKIIILTPQYNMNFSGFFKNILDWLSIKKVKFLQDKSVIFVSIGGSKKPAKKYQQISAWTFKYFGTKNFWFIDWKSLDQDFEFIEKICESNE